MKAEDRLKQIYQDFEVGPLKYRTEFRQHDNLLNWWYAGCPVYSTQEIDTFLSRPQYSAIRWRYLRTRDIDSYNNIVKTLPLAAVFDTLKTLCRPIYTNFTEVNEDYDFGLFAGFFYYQLFINECIYVSYNFFEKENYILPENRVQDIEIKIKALKEKGGYDAWVKLSEDEFDGTDEFMEIHTSIVVKVPKWRETFAKCRWAADHLNNFGGWFNLTVTYLVLTNMLETFLKLAIKRVLIINSGRSGVNTEKLSGQLENVNSQISMSIQDATMVKETNFVDGPLLKEVRNTVYMFIDRMMSEYGRVANTNPKGERMTTFENYKDIDAIAARTKETLEYLNSFAQQAKKLWKVDLAFAEAGIPEQEAIYSLSRQAQNPNMKKDFFGQREGTDTRVPNQKGFRKTLDKV